MMSNKNKDMIRKNQKWEPKSDSHERPEYLWKALMECSRKEPCESCKKVSQRIALERNIFKKVKEESNG